MPSGTDRVGRREADAAEFVLGRGQRIPWLDAGSVAGARRQPLGRAPRSARASRHGAATARPRGRRRATTITSVMTAKPVTAGRADETPVISARGRSAGRGGLVVELQRDQQRLH